MQLLPNKGHAYIGGGLVTTSFVDKPTVDHEVTSSPRPRAQEEVAVRRIVAETSCTEGEAYDMLLWLKPILDRARSEKGQTYLLSSEMDTAEYGLFNMVMPHGLWATDGSAHQAIATVLLDGARGEVAVAHDTTEDDLGSRTYCTVSVVLKVVSI